MKLMVVEFSSRLQRWQEKDQYSQDEFRVNSKDSLKIDTTMTIKFQLNSLTAYFNTAEPVITIMVVLHMCQVVP